MISANWQDATQQNQKGNNMRRGTLAVAGALVATGLTLAGCGSNSLSGGAAKHATGTVTLDKKAAAMVPAALKKKGTLTVGSDASYAPSEFLAGDGKTIEGFDVDLFTAVAKTIGLKADFQNANFDSIISGIDANKYDVGVSSFTINSDREKQADMTSYFNAGIEWAVPSGDPKKVDVKSPCGLSIAVQTGTVEQTDDLPPKVAACKKAGKPITVLPYVHQTDVTTAVVSGKADAMLADSPVTQYAVKLAKGKLQTVGGVYGAAPYGFVVSKDNKGLSQAIALALKDLKANGTYHKILTSWGVQQGAISSFQVSPHVAG